MPAEVVQNGLPARALELWPVLDLCVERLYYEYAAGALDEHDLDLRCGSMPLSSA